MVRLLFGGIDRIGAFLQLSPTANEDFLLRMLQNVKTGAAKHRFGAGAVRNPPIGWVAGITLLHEMKARVAGPLKNFGLPKVIVIFKRLDLIAAPLHGLKDEEIPGGVFVNQ